MTHTGCYPFGVGDDVQSTIVSSTAQSARPDARFTRKRDKAHLAVDEESGLVRQVEMISANVVHDSRLGEALIQGDGSLGKSNTPAIRSRPGRHSTTPGRGRARPWSAPSPR